MARNRRKRKGPPPTNAFGPDNPPPLSEGRPPKDRIGEEKAKDPGISDDLAAIRASLAFAGLKKRPGQPLVKFYAIFQNRNAREFQAVRERLEREWAAKKAGEQEAGQKAAVEVQTDTEKVESDVGSERAEELLEEFLKRHWAKALEKSGGA
jgi:hypothetical protein